jgi:hypothetical protein
MLADGLIAVTATAIPYDRRGYQPQNPAPDLNNLFSINKTEARRHS